MPNLTDLTETQNIVMGTIAALIESIILQPTLYWKNARAQSLPFTLNPRLLFRGTGASVFNECQMMAVQFSSSSLIQRCLSNDMTSSTALNQFLPFIASGNYYRHLLIY